MKSAATLTHVGLTFRNPECILWKHLFREAAIADTIVIELLPSSSSRGKRSNFFIVGLTVESDICERRIQNMRDRALNI
jgi:hypothetical protein